MKTNLINHEADEKKRIVFAWLAPFVLKREADFGGSTESV